MDRIICRGMEFSGCHGVLPQEKTIAQTFKLDLELFLDLRPAALKDDLALSVNYDEVFHEVKNIVEKESYQLIETLAERIAQVLLQRFSRLQEIEVTLYKPDAPVDGKFDYFAVKIRRKR